VTEARDVVYDIVVSRKWMAGDVSSLPAWGRAHPAGTAVSANTMIDALADLKIVADSPMGLKIQLA